MATYPVTQAAPLPYAAAPMPAVLPSPAPVPAQGVPVVVMPAAPPTPSSSYQGLLDRLHLVSQAATRPVSPVVLPAAVPMAPPTMLGLSDLYTKLKTLLSQWLTPAPAAPPVPTAPPASPAPSAPPSTSKKPTKTEFVISSFNVLGSSHTKGEAGDRLGYASGVERIRTAAKLLDHHDVDVVGFQEFQPDQVAEFKKVTGDTFGIYPGAKLGKSEIHNSIAWRTDTWELVKGDTIDIPYFGGRPKKMPVVRLRHKETGQEAYFANFHNPATTKKVGDHEKWRDIATEKEIDLVNKLRKETGLPVFITGDMNEREEYYEKMTEGTDMVSADTGPKGKAPKSMAIDWIFGTESMVTFDDYVRDRSAAVKKTSDHPIVVSKATIKAPKQS